MRLHIFPKCLPPRQAFFTKNCKSEIKKRRGIPRLSFLFQVLLIRTYTLRSRCRQSRDAFRRSRRCSSVLQHCHTEGLGKLADTFFRKLANFRNSFQRKPFFQHIRGNALVHFRFFPCLTFFYIPVNYVAHIPNFSLRPFFNCCLFITVVVFHYAQQLQHFIHVPHRVSGSLPVPVTLVTGLFL